MCLMISANHILMVFLGMEMASVPCYVLAGMRRSRPKGSEAALKYAVFGAGAAGIMLYGLSLLASVLGSAHLPTMAARLADLLQHGAGADQTMVLVLGGLMLTVGVAFKLSAVPFHFWAPDVFEGATAEVAAFLSVASKAAALGLLVRLATGFSFLTDPVLMESLAPARHYIATLLAVLAAVTCTFGNLAAYGQTNMKRLLAYSTIAHAGYMMMPVVAAVTLLGSDVVAARDAIASLVVYIGIYLFMNLAAFVIVAFLRNAIGSEEIADYAGLVRTSPGLTVCLAIVMFSLVGLPPLAGFSAKMCIIYAMINAKLGVLVMVAVLNTVLSLFYYLRVVRVMVMSPEPLHGEPPTIPLFSLVGLYCAALTSPVVVLFFFLGKLLDWAHAAASNLFY
jgi:NADH-quinone oxidoreductase subunit N